MHQAQARHCPAASVQRESTVVEERSHKTASDPKDALSALPLNRMAGRSRPPDLRTPELESVTVEPEHAAIPKEKPKPSMAGDALRKAALAARQKGVKDAEQARELELSRIRAAQRAISAALAAEDEANLREVLAECHNVVNRQPEFAQIPCEGPSMAAVKALDVQLTEVRQTLAVNVEVAEQMLTRMDKRSQALQSLEAAAGCTDEERMREALRDAAAVGLDDRFHQVVACKSSLERLEDRNQALVKLEQATAGMRLDLLQSAIQAAGDCGVTEDAAELVAARTAVKVLEARKQALKDLARAIAGRQAEPLRLALEAAAAAGLLDDDPQVITAQATLERVEILDVARAELVASIQAEDLEQLQVAIERAEAAGIDPAAIVAARSHMADLQMRMHDAAQAAASLETSLEEDPQNLQHIREALTAAERCHGVSSSLMDKAFKVLAAGDKSREQRMRVMAELVAAGEAMEPERLRKCLARAHEVKLEPSVIQSAETLLEEAEAQQVALVGLHAAVNDGNATHLRAAIDAANEAGLDRSTAPVAEAYAALEQAESMQCAQAELEAAVELASPKRLRTALSVAKGKGVQSELVEVASSLLTKCEQRSSAMAYLHDAIARVQEAPEQLEQALQEAERLGGVPPGVQDAAKAALEREHCRREALAELRAAVADQNVARVRDAVQHASSAGVHSELEMQDAKKMLENEERKDSLRRELFLALGKQPPDVGRLKNALQASCAAGISEEEDPMVKARVIVEAAEEKQAAVERLQEHANAARNSPPRDVDGIEAVRDVIVKGIAEVRALGFDDSTPVLKEAELVRRKLHNMLQDLQGATRVFCRVRPLNSREKRFNETVAVATVGGMAVRCTQDDGQKRMFEFDAAFGPNSTQDNIFEECKDFVQSALDGYNITIFAYGQTGAGKTFTMLGDDRDSTLKGIGPRTIEALFDAIERDRDRLAFTVTASMIEVYCQKVNDLGSRRKTRGRAGSITSTAEDEKHQLKVHVHDGRVVLEGVEERKIGCVEDLMNLLSDGNAAKHVTATVLNPGSTRSHTILSINVQVSNKTTNATRFGKILLVDLAGSERLKKSEVSGDVQKEAIEINKSLTALGDVISAVSLGKSRVPYRNHPLTLLLSDSLGGTAKTLMFVNVSPALGSLHETLMALQFATRAKTMTNQETAAVRLQSSFRAKMARKKVENRRQSVPRGIPLPKAA